MFRTVVFSCLLVAAVANPLQETRAKEDVEKFRNYLLKTKTGRHGHLMYGHNVPTEHPELYSGKFEGDIVLDLDVIEDMVEQYASGRNAVIFPGLATPWPNNTVVWKFADGVEFTDEEKEKIYESIRDIEARTCVRFRDALPRDIAFVNMTNYFWGCWANVGYRVWRGPHVMNLGGHPNANCYRHATIVHEWMHILGFFHMHTTYDRDDYVKVNYENLVPGSERDFDKHTPNLVGNLGVEYDYLSCLQYPELSWSWNGLPTIEPLREIEGTMGQRDFVTESDWLRINRYYNCPGAWD